MLGEFSGKGLHRIFINSLDMSFSMLINDNMCKELGLFSG